jgi:RHH-type proline utilization regulon transcriptional repressor/proline dehydrogenase/delta 1-pyrroline-5-carboxylate dehydrogenase
LPALPAHHDYSAVLIEQGINLEQVLPAIEAMKGPVPLIQQGNAAHAYRADWLVEERTISINTTAAGGNASLMALV